MESSRRQQAQTDLGVDFVKEDKTRKAALAKERERAAKKEEKRQEMMTLPAYNLMETTAKYMDKWGLDPILGLILPGGIGDTLSSVFSLPFIYFSLFKVKSIPLTLAVIYNSLMDVLVGAIPFFIGNVLDFFKRSYLKNLELITGFINDDKDIITEVNRKAFWTALLIVAVCFLIYWVISLAAKLVSIISDWLSSVGDWILSIF